jgi:O-antigen/teichoic acid export membrane protein
MALSDGLTHPGAGGRAIRGGLLRVGGYLIGLAATALASVLLLRHLGVVDFGRFATVTALTAVIAGLTDAGLTVVGQREWVLRSSAPQRRELLGDLLGLRLALTPAAIGLAAQFAMLAGYPTVLVRGTLIAGAGVIFINVAAALTVPMTAQLRLGAVTAVDLVRQVAIAIGIIALVPLGAALDWFFAVYLFAAAIGAAVAIALTGPDDRARPTLNRRRAQALLHESAPIAAALIVNMFYVRALIIAMSVLSTGYETGLFAASYRVLEVLIGVPAMMAGAAFPILAHAGGADDDTRLSYALRRLAQASLLVAVAMALVLAFAAEPLITLIGGEEYRAAAPVLQIQAASLLGAFLTQVWTLGLVAIRRQRALLVVNAIALIAIALAAALLIPAHGAKGAAVASVIGEAALAGGAGLMLARGRKLLRPDVGSVLKILLAGGFAVAVTLLVDLEPLPAAVLAAVTFTAAAFALRVVPMELVTAVMRRGRY